MNEKAVAEPFLILRQIEESCLSCVDTNQEQSPEIDIELSAIAFRVAGNYLLAPLVEVVEILDVPQMTRVPMAQPWLRGIANVRGNLLPVSDLLGVTGRDVATVTDQTRIMVIQCNGIFSGLLVDEVCGLKHFSENEQAGSGQQLDDCLQPYIGRCFLKDDHVWTEFSLISLASTPQFQQAAV